MLDKGYVCMREQMVARQCEDKPMRQATEADNKLGIKGVSKGPYCSLAMLDFFLEPGRRNSSFSCVSKLGLSVGLYHPSCSDG
jgi:hypothetical protein